MTTDAIRQKLLETPHIRQSAEDHPQLFSTFLELAGPTIKLMEEQSIPYDIRCVHVSGRGQNFTLIPGEGDDPIPFVVRQYYSGAAEVTVNGVKQRNAITSDALLKFARQKLIPNL